MQYDTIEGVQGVCPVSWHIPADAELTTLSTSVGGDANALKAIGQGAGAGAGTNTSGFSGLLAGYRGPVGTFSSVGWDGFFRSSTGSGTDAMYRYLTSGNANIYNDTSSKLYGFSVRCVKD